MSKPEDPDNWRFKPSTKLFYSGASYQSLSSSILPAGLMRDISMQSHDELEMRFQNLRAQIQELQKLYYHYSLQVSKYNLKKDFSKVSSLDIQRKGYSETIDTYKQESVAICLDLCRRTDFEKVDLHGLYLEEAEELVMMVLREVKERIRRNLNSHNSGANGVGKQLEIVTGKGIHSQGKAVLLPKIKEYLEKMGHKVGVDKGRLLIRVK